MPAHALLAVLCTGLSLGDAFAGRPFAAWAWGAWFVVASGGAALAMHVSSWEQGGAGWAVIVLLAAWSWIPPTAAWLGGLLGERRERTLARRAVRRRQAALAASQGGQRAA